LNMAIDARVFKGWTVNVPRPLEISSSPLALTMTAVRGKQLGYFVGRRIDPTMLCAAAEALAAIMVTAWQNDERHGDFGLRNILFDFETKTIGIVDPGTKESCEPCHQAQCGSDSASMDLGHLVAELVTDVNDLIGNPSTRMYKHIFVSAVLSSVLAGAGSRQNQQRFRDNLRHSVEAHLTSLLVPAATPRGIWHGAIKMIAERRLAHMLAQLDPELKADAELTPSRAA
jgi:hypothetical protein